MFTSKIINLHCQDLTRDCRSTETRATKVTRQTGQFYLLRIKERPKLITKKNNNGAVSMSWKRVRIASIRV